MSNGKILTVGVEPNLAMHQTFYLAEQVVGASLCLSAFGAHEDEGEVGVVSENGKNRTLSVR